MTTIENYLAKLEKDLPDLLKTTDLVKLGYIKYIQDVHALRHRGACPPYFRVGKRVFYPKEGVIKWIKENSNDGCETQSAEG